MRLVSTGDLRENTILAKPVCNDNGQVLISDAVPLSKRMIQRLVELGITFVYIKDERTEDIEVQHPLSDQTKANAITAIENAFELAKKEDELSKVFVYKNLAQTFSSLVETILGEIKANREAISLLSDIFIHDNYIFSHSLNVTIYTLALGLELKLPQKRLEEVGLGAMLHDIGKVMLPLDVLLKPERLTEEEYMLVKKHTEFGFNMLRHIPNIPLVAAHCAYQHHERIDGTGYPRGLKGNEIHLYSKIVGIADVYDAVTTNRVYRSAMLPNEGLEILYAGSGTLFEQEMVEAFRRAIAVYPIGLTVILNDGRKGIVVRQNEKLSDRPVVRILYDQKDLILPYELDLSKELSYIIVETDTTLISKKQETIQLLDS